MPDDLKDPRVVHERQEEVQIVDVREKPEWDAGRIEGSVHIPLSELMAGRLESLDTSRPVVAVCRTGNRSEVAALMLRARGFDAHNMEGGTEAWVAAGFPFTAPDGSPGRVA
ncbi:MAG TPA: rhodanese-like domain-containing protein [Actinomycetota bacterium]|jgi:rhodanese-related sulfurtransferase|nr:rhodanese-like domain-containing protein [Actinomycetota bacterium]